MNPKNRLSVSALSVIACYLPVHGYRLFHLLASGDSLLQLYQDDAAWEISLGRFMQPFVNLFRGGYTTPLLINLLMIAWLVLAVFFATLYLRLETKRSVAFVAAFFVINRTLVMLNGSYLPWADSYVFSLFLAVCGLWLASEKKTWRIISAAVLFAVSMGLYQAYICVATGLAAIRLYAGLATKDDKRETVRCVTGEALAFVLAGVLYVAGWKGLQAALGIADADGYNGMAGLGKTLPSAFSSSVLGTVYGNVWRYFLEPARIQVMTFRGLDLGDVWVWVFRLANVLVTALILYDTVRVNREKKTGGASRAMQAGLLVLFPLCVNFVCLLSGGMQHVLMMYAFQLHYVTAVVMREAGAKVPDAKEKDDPRTAAQRPGPLTVLLFVLAFFILWPQVIYANQIYLKKSLQEEAAQSLMMRVLEEVESAEGYVPGETPVCFVGSLERNPYIEAKDVMTDEMPWGEMTTAFTYGGMERKWLSFFEHMAVRTETEVPQGEAVEAMPCFPVQGSVGYVDGVLVVKLSE